MANSGIEFLGMEMVCGTKILKFWSFLAKFVNLSEDFVWLGCSIVSKLCLLCFSGIFEVISCRVEPLNDVSCQSISYNGPNIVMYSIVNEAADEILLFNMVISVCVCFCHVIYIPKVHKIKKIKY